MAFVPVYIFILLFTILVDFYAGLFMENYPKHKRNFLLISIIVNVGTLCFFKYYNFFNNNITALLGKFAVQNPLPYLDILLPIGLSFHTFQAMSYTIEVYRGNQKAERHPGIYALYVMFYPQLVAGPIERPQNLLYQLKKEAFFDYDRIISGLRMILWGLFKKIVIADRLGIYVDAVFISPSHQSCLSCIIASVFFAFQIYCDFSGYSNIALGVAKVLDIKLMQNFNSPFFSRSITEYWRRWHISLSTWFSDYLFTPLATRVRNWGKLSIAFALLVTFFISGLWHGAGWTFIIWGLLHSLAMSYEYFTKKLRKRVFGRLPFWLNNPLSILFTFSFVTFALIFFRATTLDNALTIVNNIFTCKPGKLLIGFAAGFVYSIFLILFLLLSEVNTKLYNNKYSLLFSKRYLIRLTGYASLIILILLIGVIDGGQFIYFQF